MRTAPLMMRTGALLAALTLAACGTSDSAGAKTGATSSKDAASGDSVASIGDAVGGGDGSVSSDGAGSGGGSDGGATRTGDAGASSSGGDTGSGTTRGDTTGGGSSGGGNGGPLVWPKGPEDDIKGKPASEAKYTDCGGMWGCLSASCSLDPGPGCVDVCLKAASTGAVADFNDVTKCAVHTCAKGQCAGKTQPGDKCLPECIWSRCVGLAIACNAAPGKAGTKGCGDGVGCLEPCKGEMGCMTSCYEAMNTAGQGSFTAFWGCVAQATGDNPAAQCYGQLLSCGANGVVGQAGCYDVLQCSSGCDNKAEGEEFACNSACYGKGSKAAQGQYQAIMSCFVSFETGVPGQGCAKKFADCVQPTGKLNCLDVSPCSDACQKQGKDEGACTFECLKKAKPDEAERFLDLYLCIGITCGNKCKDSKDPTCQNTCITTDCKAQYSKCIGA